VRCALFAHSASPVTGRAGSPDRALRLWTEAWRNSFGPQLQIRFRLQCRCAM